MADDLPALLAPGFHEMTLEGLFAFAVSAGRFSLSGSRARIMNGLWIVAGQLSCWGIRCKLWIDGSFLTEKIDPKDVDLAVVLEPGFLDNANTEQIGMALI